MSHRSDVRRHRRVTYPWRVGVGVLCATVIAGGIGFVVHERRPHPATNAAVEDRTDRASRGDARTSTEPSPTPTPTTAPTPVPPKSTPQATSPAPPRTTAPRTTQPAVPAACTSYSGNRRTACSLLPSFGFTISQMSALDQLWEHESGWNHLAENPSSGAYGIPQSLPGDKMATAGADWRTNPATQIRWGLGYIKQRYGTPAEAWAFWQDNNWY